MNIKMKWLYISVLISMLFFLWSLLGMKTVGVHVDLARDLYELSNLWIGNIVWLGPHLSAGFPISPLYYYLLLPGLVLSNANPHSIIISQTFFAIIPFAVLTWMHTEKKLSETVVTILTLGLAPWWVDASSHPWNGHMYISFVLLFCVLAWYKKHIAFSSVSLGIAIALHPASALLLPILMYQWWQQKQKITSFVLLSTGLLLPWIPIIIFEIITKGFLIRQFLSLRTNTIRSDFTLEPFIQFQRMSDLSSLVFLILCGLTMYFAEKRARIWLLLVFCGLFLTCFFSGLHEYYYFGVLTAFFFISTTVLAKYAVGRAFLILVIIIFTKQLYNTPVIPSQRSLNYLDSITTESIKHFDLNKETSYAVALMLDEMNSTPQADEYRFFLRTKGFTVVNADQHGQAESLLLFIEVDDFDVEKWSHYSLDSFGEREIVKQVKIQDVEVVQFERVD